MNYTTVTYSLEESQLGEVIKVGISEEFKKDKEEIKTDSVTIRYRYYP